MINNLSLRQIWTISRRDMNARIRGLRLLVICLFLGVATLAAIGSLIAGIGDELSNRGQTILGGDLEIDLSQRLATNEELAAFGEIGTLSQTVRLRAMANIAEPQQNLLSELKAIDNQYPLYGALTLKDGREANAPAIGEIFVGETLSDQMQLNIGDSVSFGEADFKISGIIGDEPDRLGEGFTLGPVALINMKSLESTQLIQPGSLYTAKYRIKTDDGADIEAISASLDERFPQAGWRITDRSNGAPGTRRFVERMGQFLTLVGLASLVIAGIGVGNGVASYLENKRKSIATLKVLGADSRTIFNLYFLQILFVGSLAVIAGLVMGSILPLIITLIAGDILPISPGLAIYPLPLIISASYGLLIAIAFALPPLSKAKTITSAGLFRNNQGHWAKIDKITAFWVIMAALSIAGIAIATAREPFFSFAFIVAALGLLGLLSLVAWIIRMIAMRIPRPKRPLFRLALTNLHRPGAQTSALVVALGLGLTLFVTLSAIQTSINSEISKNIPDQAPSFFALDIPKDDAPAFTKIVNDIAPEAVINLVPIMRGSIISYGGQRVDELEEIPEGAWVLRGDRGLTYSAQLPNGSEVVNGKWWPEDYSGKALVSVDIQMAEILDLELGDIIIINVLGAEFEAEVASFRRVDWDNFGLNFSMIFSPASLDNAPHNMTATITVDAAKEAELSRAIPANFPSSTLIKVKDIVSQVSNLLNQMSKAIAAAASISILAGIAVLIGAIAASRMARTYDSVILKLLGSTRRQILTTQALEYLLLASIISLLSFGIGMTAAYYVIVHIFEFSFLPDMRVVTFTVVGGALITFLLGMIGSLPILAARPASALRSL